MVARANLVRVARRVAVLAVLAATLTSAPSLAALAQDPTVAPTTSLSADGRTVTGAGRTLTVSQAQGLAPGGQSITVSGSGYDIAKGVYVTLCLIPPTNLPPTPCGGGQDLTGTSGASAWISSNPPDYAAGLTQPYGAGGTFTVTIQVGAQLNPTLDCLTVRCAVVTRNDHTRGSDRSQDLFVPVTFASGTTPPPTSDTTAPPPVVTTTTATTTTLPPAPTTSIAADGRSATNGTQRVAVSVVADLDPAGDSVTVSGDGFDPAAGIYVALCRVPDVGAAPGPCSAGDGAAAWLSSNPPDYGIGVAEPFEEGGRFRVTLELAAVIDDATDCRVVACAVTTRRDDTAAADRLLDLLVPVTFAAETTPSEGSEDGDGADEQAAAESAPPANDDDGNGLIIAAAVLVALAGATAVLVRRRQQAKAAG